MNEDLELPRLRELAAESGTSLGRLQVLVDILTYAGESIAGLSDADLDKFWAKVDGDRDAFGLTPTNIVGLSQFIKGPHGKHIISKSDATGIGPTYLTDYGRDLIRKLLTRRVKN